MSIDLIPHLTELTEPGIPQDEDGRIEARGVDAMATWSLARVRHLVRPDPLAAKKIRHLLEGVRSARRLEFEGRSTAIRPAVSKLITYLRQFGGEAMHVRDISHAVYGRPVTLRSIRQTVFRLNRAFERVGCPITMHCQSLTVFPRRKISVFEKA